MSTIYHVGISGGKDSAALLLWMVYESGIPREQIRATFCDTGNEVSQTLAHVAMLSEQVHPIETIYPKLDFYQLALKKKRFPSARARFCTEHLKIRPTMAHVEKLRADGTEVILCSGVRRGESEARASLPEHSYNEVYDCEEWRPLITWGIDDVWAIHERYSIPRNPLYAMGAARVGCAPCVMSRMAEIALMARHFPERIERIRQAEADARTTASGGATFFSPNKVPLRFRSEKWVQPATPKKSSKEPRPKDGTQEVFDLDMSAGWGARPWKDGEGKIIYLATIDDVIARANAIDDGTQEDFDLRADAPASCADRWGLCE